MLATVVLTALSGYIWAGATSFMRAGTEAYLLASLVIMSARQWRMVSLLCLPVAGVCGHSVPPALYTRPINADFDVQDVSLIHSVSHKDQVDLTERDIAADWKGQGAGGDESREHGCVAVDRKIDEPRFGWPGKIVRGEAANSPVPTASEMTTIDVLGRRR